MYIDRDIWEYGEIYIYIWRGRDGVDREGRDIEEEICRSYIYGGGIGIHNVSFIVAQHLWGRE